MVLTLAIPLRKWYHLEQYVTARHLNNMAKVMLSTGLIVAYGYIMEVFTGLVYSANANDHFLTMNRMTGPYAIYYWTLIATNIIIPQSLWFKRVCSNTIMLFAVAIVINIGMWLERFMIVVTSLHRDFLPSSWGMYNPSFWDWATFAGSIGLFLTLLILFIRFLPMISIAEMRQLASEGSAEHAQ